jgi:hypothetical protein
LASAYEAANWTDGQLSQLESKVQQYISSVFEVDNGDWRFETNPYYTDPSIIQTADRLFKIKQALFMLGSGGSPERSGCKRGGLHPAEWTEGQHREHNSELAGSAGR